MHLSALATLRRDQEQLGVGEAHIRGPAGPCVHIQKNLHYPGKGKGRNTNIFPFCGRSHTSVCPDIRVPLQRHFMERGAWTLSLLSPPPPCSCYVYVRHASFKKAWPGHKTTPCHCEHHFKNILSYTTRCLPVSALMGCPPLQCPLTIYTQTKQPQDI
jgi:hypothetical protein